jgi:ABC-type polar amino acid transport system ATPase subunit
VRGIDLAVRRHETVVIVGPSGSGKTTLLRCLNYLAPPTVGTVRIGDVTVEADPFQKGGRERRARISRLRQRIGMVFQEFNLFPHMTVLENCIEAPMSVKGLARARAVETAERFLEKVHLIDKRDEYPARLSSGQKQRAAIARALSMEPEVMLFDEPTSALDAELVGEVLRVMEELAHEGATMVVVTHQILFAREAADRVVFINEGVVVEEGPPEQVLSDPVEPATRTFLRRYLGEVAVGPA